LERLGYEAHAAAFPADVLQLSRTHPPDVLIMDVIWPGTNGYVLAREVCAIVPSRPLLIAMTGHSGLEARTREEGIDFHFLKPCDGLLLKSVIDHLSPGR
jgi:CheY-like chemotaxis protein